MSFDQAVFACHGNQILPLLESPTDRSGTFSGLHHQPERGVPAHGLRGCCPGGRQRALVELPSEPGAAAGATLTYHMNRLQSLGVPEDYCVTLNATAAMDPSKVLRRMVYHHPLYTRGDPRQARWSEISGRNRTHYCGAYWFYGFHEDGLNSALRVARALGVDVLTMESALYIGTLGTGGLSRRGTSSPIRCSWPCWTSTAFPS